MTRTQGCRIVMPALSPLNYGDTPAKCDKSGFYVNCVCSTKSGCMHRILVKPKNQSGPAKPGPVA